jgi:hypothetical protein
MASALRQRVVDPPVEFYGPISADTVLGPTVTRDTDPLDLGWHYEPLDYLLSEVAVASATLTLTNGVAVGVWGPTGFKLQPASRLVSEGTPSTLNRLVRYVAVQEQSHPGYPTDNAGTLFAEDLTAGLPPEINLRFTELPLLAWGGQHFGGGSRLGSLVLRDCQLWGGNLYFDQAGNALRTVAFTNTLFKRVGLNVGTGSDVNLTAFARNCLFRSCQPINLNAAPVNNWAWHDNLFDNSPVSLYYGSVANSHNGYLGCSPMPGGTGNVPLGSFTYATGLLGRFYHSSTSLQNLGSRSAAAAGLYHYTTRTSQAKEGNTIVDIGYHYVAFCSGAPCDADQDGLPDWWEDANGNGVSDTGESDWQDADTDDDGVDDGDEIAGGTDPTNPDSDYDGVGDLLDQSPLNPDSDGDGWPDGAELAPDPLLYLFSYSLNANRDLTTIGRAPNLPDATVSMTWSHNASSSMDVTGDMTECYDNPPPEAIKQDGTEYRWPSAGDGAKQYWKITFANPDKQYDPAQTSPRPPSAEIWIPWEKCIGFAATNTNAPFTGTFSRSALATVHLKSDAPTWPKQKRSVVLYCSADDLTAGDVLPPTAWATGNSMGEPNTWPGGAAIDPAVTPIEVDSTRVDPSGFVLVQVDKVGERDVTPQVQDNGIKWYRYASGNANPRPVTLTWSRHPDVAQPPDLQACFDMGSQRLGRDDDGTGEEAEIDDVSVFVEFFIFPAKQKVFPDRLRDSKWFIIEEEEDANKLLDETFANIKIVSSMQYYSLPHGGVITPAGLAKIGQPSCILVENLPAITAVHEWGHMVGCDERAGHPEAIMYPRPQDFGLMVEVNSAEAELMNTTPCPVWGW